MDAYKAITTLNSFNFIHGLMTSKHKKFHTVFSKKSMDIQNALLTEVISNITPETTDEEIIIKASEIISNILFPNFSLSGHCKISPALIQLFCKKLKPEVYDILRAKYKVVFDIRTLKGLYSQFEIFALKQMEPVLTFINSLFNAEMEVKDANDKQKHDIFFKMIAYYIEYLFECAGKCSDLKLIPYEACLEALVEMAIQNS